MICRLGVFLSCSLSPPPTPFCSSCKPPGQAIAAVCFLPAIGTSALLLTRQLSSRTCPNLDLAGQTLAIPAISPTPPSDDDAILFDPLQTSAYTPIGVPTYVPYAFGLHTTSLYRPAASRSPPPPASLCMYPVCDTRGLRTNESGASVSPTSPGLLLNSPPSEQRA